MQMRVTYHRITGELVKPASNLYADPLRHSQTAYSEWTLRKIVMTSHLEPPRGWRRVRERTAPATQLSGPMPKRSGYVTTEDPRSRLCCRVAWRDRSDGRARLRCDIWFDQRHLRAWRFGSCDIDPDQPHRRPRHGNSQRPRYDGNRCDEPDDRD